MRFQVLISTVDDCFFYRDVKLNFSSIIINQLIKKQKSNYDKSELYSFQEKGLSRSRNKALRYALSDICLVSDDDIVYKNNIEKLVVDTFDRYPEADIITFQVETPEGEPYKNYKDRPFSHSLRTLMTVSSVEIAIRRNRIIKTGLSFDERFGLGTEYPTGEEFIFLSDALRKGLKILYVPIPIVVHPRESSGGAFVNNPKLIEAKGAMFYRVFGSKAYLISVLFALRKYKMARVSFIHFFKLMLVGIKRYKNEA